MWAVLVAFGPAALALTLLTPVLALPAAWIATLGRGLVSGVAITVRLSLLRR